MGIGFSKEYLKKTLTALNGSSSSVISGIWNPFSFRNIDKNYFSVRNSTQFLSSKLFPDNSIDIEVTKLMSSLKTSHWKRLVLNIQLHVNVLLPKLLHQIVILPVHIFIMTLPQITLAILHMK